MWDAVIIGGGPAGATLARLLARWGYRAVICTRKPAGRSRAESLPPSINHLFELLDIRDEVERCGFYPDSGNTSWWLSENPRVEHFAAGATGYHVDRAKFDALLLQLAVRAGAQLSTAPVTAPRRFTIDCSGRAGALSRGRRRIDHRYRTVAFCAEWTGAWDAEPSHALVEAYAGGWAWSVPLSLNRRHLAFMVDHGVQRGGAAKAYACELGKTRVFRRLFETSRMEGEPWASDASLYNSTSYAGPDYLIAGDAGCTVDPLSSFGVKKALIAAWMGAVVVNTCLARPEMAAHAIAFYNDRERQTYADHARQAAAQFGEVTARFPTPFWTARATLTPDLMLYDPERLRDAHQRLRDAPALRLKLREPLRREQVPAITGREVTLVERLVIPGLPRTVEYVQGVNLVQLARIAGGHTGVPSLFDAYNAAASPVALPNFVSALSFLLAGGILINIADRRLGAMGES